ncbi:MAG: aminotransferase class V-fold PLP-dependent enzyme, partial [Clostridiaceae bacterium]|nr:aminotransferase class V-fold PLP-dependent enzyme [Clostridiaceae bacterium]
ESLNLISYAYGLSYLKPGDHILITRMEHHSNCVNWQFVAEKTGAELIYIDIKDNDYTLDMADYEAKLSNKTKIVAFSAASNVLGTMPDSKKIIELAHAVGAITVVDAAQLALHAKIDVKALNCDFLAFSGHKMLAPFGIGVLYGKKELLSEMPPFLYGGEMIEYVEDYSSTFAELPYKFESGTQDVGGMVGLASAIEYINKIGLPTIADYENALTSYTKEKLEKLDYIEIYHAKQEMTAPVIAFNVKDAHPHDVATILDHYGVAVRAGHHCTQPLHRRLGQNATNRVSFAFYNTKEEVDTFIDALAEVRTIMHLD